MHSCDSRVQHIIIRTLLAPLLEKKPNPSSVALTKYILNTISDESNPIAHSDIPQRAGLPLLKCFGAISSSLRPLQTM